MKRTFDPEIARRILLRDGGYEWALGRKIEDSAAVGGVGSSANARLARSINCFLVNFDEPASQLLDQVHHWVSWSIEARERADKVAAHFYAGQRYETLALCNWLQHRVHDANSLRQAVNEYERHYQIKDGKDRVGVSLGIAPYVDLGDWELCDRRLDIAGIRPPATLSALRTEGGLAKIICGHHLRNEYTPEQVDEALRRGLKMWMNRWLASDGAYVRAAQWLKIAHWRQGGGLTPKQTIMKAYDYLPGVTPPG
jgi:hypothetical protein